MRKMIQRYIYERGESMCTPAFRASCAVITAAQRLWWLLSGPARQLGGILAHFSVWKGFGSGMYFSFLMNCSHNISIKIKVRTPKHSLYSSFTLFLRFTSMMPSRPRCSKTAQDHDATTAVFHRSDKVLVLECCVFLSLNIMFSIKPKHYSFLVSSCGTLACSFDH